MNYILQLNGFRLRRRLCPIPMSAIALYYVILENFNQVGFPDSLEIPIGILAGELSTCDNTVRRASRNYLTMVTYFMNPEGKSTRLYIS